MKQYIPNEQTLKAIEAGARLMLVKIEEKYKNIEVRDDMISYEVETPEDKYISGYFSNVYIEDFIEIRLQFKQGDEIYIAEKWRLGYWNNKDKTIALDFEIGKDKSLKHPTKEQFKELVDEALNELDMQMIYPNEDGEYEWEKYNSPLHWHNASEMTEQQSRFKFKVGKVSVNRVQDIYVTAKELGLEEYKNKSRYVWWEDWLKDQGIDYNDNQYVALVELKETNEN